MAIVRRAARCRPVPVNSDVKPHMQLTPDCRDEASLSAFGWEATRLLRAGEIEMLTEHYGYALAFDRDPVAAIRQDLATSLSEVGSAGLAQTGDEDIRVSYFNPNDTGLLGLVQCIVPTDNGKHILLELVVTSNGAETHVTLEQLSAAA